jgi:hypothetical protein
MTSADSKLPPGFEALEPFVNPWAAAGTANRARLRLVSDEQGRTAFYNAAKDLAAPALAHLDRKTLTDLDERENRLMNLLLSLCHVALAVEAQGPDETRHGQMRAHMKITRATADHGA